MARGNINNKTAFTTLLPSDVEIITETLTKKQTDVLTDDELVSSDTRNMIEHGRLYTRLLDVYVKNAEETLSAKRKLKKEFYSLCETILGITSGLFACIIFMMMTGVISTENTSVLIGTYISFLTVFIVIPHTITKYLFNADEEKYMTDIIKSVQNHDVKIREEMRK